MDTLTNRQWLEKELEFIRTETAHTLNGKLAGELLSCDDEKKEIIFRFPLASWQINGLGTLHGGIANTMMDLAMSIAVYCFSRQSIPPTVSMSTNYLRPIPIEEYVHIRTSVTSIGRRNATAYCEAVIPSSGKVACTAIGTYAIVAPK